MIIMSYNPEMSEHVDRVFKVEVFGGQALLPAQDELRNLQLVEGMAADDETVEALAIYQATELNELRRGDTAHIIGSGQYYLDTRESSLESEVCEDFFNIKNGRLEGRYVDMLATTWPRYDNFFKEAATIDPEATLCVELENATVYDSDGAVQAYYPNHLVYVPLNNTQYAVYRAMNDWLGEKAL